MPHLAQTSRLCFQLPINLKDRTHLFKRPLVAVKFPKAMEKLFVSRIAVTEKDAPCKCDWRHPCGHDLCGRLANPFGKRPKITVNSNWIKLDMKWVYPYNKSKTPSGLTHVQLMQRLYDLKRPLMGEVKLWVWYPPSASIPLVLSITHKFERHDLFIQASAC